MAGILQQPALAAACACRARHVVAQGAGSSWGSGARISTHSSPVLAAGGPYSHARSEGTRGAPAARPSAGRSDVLSTSFMGDQRLEVRRVASASLPAVPFRPVASPDPLVGALAQARGRAD